MSAPPTHPQPRARRASGPPRYQRAARWLVLVAWCCAGSGVSGSSRPPGEALAPPGLARVVTITPGADGPRIWDFTGWYPSLGAWMRQNPDGGIAYETCGFPSNCVTRPGLVTAFGANVGVDVPLIWEYTDPTGSGYWYTSGLSLSVAQDRRSLSGFRRTTVFIPEALYPALRDRWRPHFVAPGINYLSDLVTVPLPSGVDGSWRLDLEEAPDGGRFGAAASLVLSSSNAIAFHVQETQPTVTKSVLHLQGATGGNSLQLVLLGPERTLHSLQGTVARQPVLLNAPAATNALTIEVHGQGAVGLLTNGAPLVIGRDYALTATPRPGHLFSNWVVSGLAVTTSVLRFTTTSNLVITANFVPNPFPALQGAYAGLFAATNTPAHENAGLLRLTLAGSGKFSGRLRQGAASLPFSGRFGLDLSASCSVRRPGTNHLLLHLRLAEGSDRLTGTVDNADATSDLAGFRAGFSGRFPATHYQGTCTLLLPGALEPGNGPMGHGFARVRVSRTGLVSFQGTLGDGTPALQVVPLAAGGQWPCYVGLQGGRGSLFGWLTFIDTPTNDLAGALQWTKPAGLPGRVHPGGFTNRLEVLGSRYVPPAPGTRALDLTAGRFVLEGGHLDDPLAVEVTLSEANRVTVTSTNAPGVTLMLLPATGGFRGSFHHPATGRVLPVNGVMLQKQKLAGGLFLDTDLSGSATLLPRPQQP